MAAKLQLRPHVWARRDSRSVSCKARAHHPAAEPVKVPGTDMEVSRCTLGTMTWGQQNTEEEAHSQLDMAVNDYGIKSIDTAEVYPVPLDSSTWGRTDNYIGSWLKNQKREDLTLLTKVAGRSERLDYIRDGGTCVSPEQIRESVEGSLRRLNVDCIDVLQIHWPDRYVPTFGRRWYLKENEYDSIAMEDQLEGLKRMVDEGKVRAVGLSNETPYGITRFTELAAKDSLPKVATVQNCYSLLVRQQIEVHLPEVLSSHNCNVGLLAYSPLAGGALSGKYLQPKPPEGSRFTMFPSYMSRYQTGAIADAVKEYMGVAEKYGKSPTQLALQFCKSRWFCTSTIIGATTLEQLKQNIEAFEGDISDDQLSEINSIFWRLPDPSSVD